MNYYFSIGRPGTECKAHGLLEAEDPVEALTRIRGKLSPVLREYLITIDGATISISKCAACVCKNVDRNGSSA